MPAYGIGRISLKGHWNWCRFLLPLALWFGHISEAANAPEFVWLRSARAGDLLGAGGVAVDSFGNLFVAGWFSSSLEFGSTNLMTATFRQDSFVAKYDPQGSFLWARKPGEAGDDWANDVAVDRIGNCYITGYYQGIAHFDGISISNYFVVNARGLFVVKYTSDGVVEWVANATCTNFVGGNSLAIDREGNVYVVGALSGTAHFENVTIGGGRMFVAKYDINGRLKWVRQTSPSALVGGSAIAVDDFGNAYITGSFRTAVGFDDVTLETSTNAQAIFLVCYNADGNVIWARKASGPREDTTAGTDGGGAVAVDDNRNVYVAGYFGGVTSFEGITITNLGEGDIFLAKYDSLGNAHWVRQVGGLDRDIGTGVSLDPSGNPHLTGYFWSNVLDIGGNAIEKLGSGLSHVIVIRYDPLGTVRGVVQAGGTGYLSYARNSIDALGNSYLVGEAYGNAPVLFGTNTLAGSSDPRLFVTKLQAFPPILSFGQTPSGIIIQWPNWLPNFQAEHTEGLSENALWIQITNAPAKIDDKNVLTNDVQKGARFFRLRSQP